MEIDISAEVGEAIAELERIGGDIPDALGKGLDEAAFIVEDAMKTYPMQRPTTYVRTVRLGRSWTTRPIREPGAIGRSIGNNTKYAPQVQSSELQAAVHRGWWQTDEDVLADNQRAIVEVITDALVRGIR